MVFRRDSKVDAFQRQISALRHQLGGESEEADVGAARDRPRSIGNENSYLSDYPEFASITSGRPPSSQFTTGALDTLQLDAVAPVPAIDMHTSVVAHSTVWTGDFESSGSLHIHGRVEGSLTARDSIFIAEEAEVEAVIRAANVTIAGKVRGSIHCTDRFEVLPHGKVAGDIHAPAIAIHDGALIAGDISMTMPNSAKAVMTPPLRVARGGD